MQATPTRRRHACARPVPTPHGVVTCAHTQGWGPCRTCRRQAPGSREELGHSPRVGVSLLYRTAFSTSLPPLSLPLCISVSVSFPMSRSLFLGLSPSPRFLFPINTCRSLGPWVQPPPPAPRCAAGAPPPARVPRSNLHLAPEGQSLIPCDS